jgi:hypothetical protein
MNTYSFSRNTSKIELEFISFSDTRWALPACLRIVKTVSKARAVDSRDLGIPYFSIFEQLCMKNREVLFSKLLRHPGKRRERRNFPKPAISLKTVKT